MTTYISILRGINVSGYKTIKMDALRKIYESLGFKTVQTYIQSGNVVFRYKLTEIEKLEKKIAQKIFEQFSFEVPVMVKTFDELNEIVNSNPLVNDPSKDAAHLHVTFLSAKPEKSRIEKITEEKYGTGEFAILDKAIYLYCPDGYSNSKLSNTFLESKLKVVATTGNWKTTRELLSMAEKLEAK